MDCLGALLVLLALLFGLGYLVYRQGEKDRARKAYERHQEIARLEHLISRARFNPRTILNVEALERELSVLRDGANDAND